MYDHSSAVYNNRCLKAPRNPKNDHPLTQFDQKFLHQLHNEVTRGLNEKMKTNLGDCSEGNVKSFIDFFDSIPEYDDINYLSNREFYKKLARIKEKQKEFCAYWNRELKFETKDTEWIEDYKNLKSGQREMSSAGSKSKKSSIKADCDKKYLDLEENLSLSDKDLMVKPPSRRSVRIETPSTKSTPNLTPEPCSRPKSRLNWEDLILDVSSIANTPLPLETKSVPNSPVKRGKSQETYDGITIPKPFQMTIRDEENRIVEEIFLKTHKPEKEDVKTQQFKAHDVPIESQIPLFDKIMEDQQRRSQKSKEQRKANLQAQMRPFSFTKRDEEIQELTRKFSKSLPCVYNDEPPLKSKKFKANPIPRNLFSNYIYKKMHEDEFYRAIQKKVRAEEMLKQASLPPSMAKREMCKPKVDVCPRSFRELQIDEDIKKVSRRKTRKIPNYKAYHDKYERELEELKNEFISTSPRPFKFNKPSKKRLKRGCRRISSAASKCSSDSKTLSSIDLSSINRSNLAAILRIQSARKRLEMEMAQKLEEVKLKEEARWREKVLRKKPVWQALAYSHEDDLAMRLQLRRDEEKLRNEEHRLRMELMLGRVNQQPTLFERQSHPHKFPKTKEEIVEQLHKTLNKEKRAHNFVKIKDEGIPVKQSESLEDSRRNSRDSETTDDKEECECLLELK